jgi:hypothetical protein
MRFERTIISTSPLDKEQGQSCIDLEALLGAESATPRIKMDPYTKTAAVRHKRFLEEMARWQKKLDDSEANDIMMRTKMGLPLPSRYQQPSSPAGSPSSNQGETTLGSSADMVAAGVPPVLLSLDQKKAAVKQVLLQPSTGSLEQSLWESGLASDEGSANLVSSLMVALDGVDVASLTAEERQQVLNMLLVEIDPAEAALIDEPVDVPETGSYYRRLDEVGSRTDIVPNETMGKTSGLKSSSTRRLTGSPRRRPGSAVFMPKYSKLPPRPGTSASTPGMRKVASSQRFRPSSSQGVPRPVSADPLSARLNLISSTERKPIKERPVQATPTLDAIVEPSTASALKAEVVSKIDRAPEVASPPRPFTPSERKVNVASLTVSKSSPSLLATQKPESAQGGPILSPIGTDIYPPVRKTGKQWSVKKRPHRSCEASLRRRTGAVSLDPSWKPPLAVDPNILLLEAIQTTAEYKQVRPRRIKCWLLGTCLFLSFLI